MRTPEYLRAYRASYYAKNRERIKAYNARYRVEQKDKYDAQQLSYRKRNMENKRLAAAKWRAANPGRQISMQAQWRADNQERFKKRIKMWNQANKDKCNAWVARRRSAKFRATPKWANAFFISEAYHLAALRTKATGFAWHVDHIVPLRSKLVCGLHVEHNLQVIPASQNSRKKNYYWPNMPGS